MDVIMSSPHLAKQPEFDRELIRELARCYARAAVDAMLDENEEVTTTKANKDEIEKDEIDGKRRTV
jgi:hypothetical protein